MAQTATAETEPRQIGEVTKNSREVLKVRRVVYEGKELIDVRSFALSATETLEPRPTRHGLSLRPATWRDLLPLIEEALAWGLGDRRAGS